MNTIQGHLFFWMDLKLSLASMPYEKNCFTCYRITYSSGVSFFRTKTESESAELR